MEKKKVSLIGLDRDGSWWIGKVVNLVEGFFFK